MRTTPKGWFAFSTGSPGLPGVVRRFGSFAEAAAEAGRSRVFGGIHFNFADRDGQALGAAVGRAALEAFAVDADLRPPTLRPTEPLAGAVLAGDAEARGLVLDMLSGVALLEARLGDGPAFAVAFDGSGRFTIPLAGLADGPHILRLHAADAAGNVAPVLAVAFAVDTRPPTLALQSPAAGSTLVAGARLSGAADGTGSAIVALSYRIGDGPAVPIGFDRASGRFDAVLDLSRLGVGSHTLTVTARDASGRQAEHVAEVRMDAPVPFALAATQPKAGAVEVGSTFRPRVDFTRPVDPA